MASPTTSSCAARGRTAKPSGFAPWRSRRSSTGKSARVFGAVQDITDRKLAEERIRDLAFRDPLTGLPNRASFIDKLDTAVRPRRTKARRVALIKFDVDHFREVNDALGHKIGDGLLQTIASTLWQEFSTVGTVARIGGNEFALMLRGPERRQGARLRRRVYRADQDAVSRPRLRRCRSGSVAASPLFPDHGDDSEAIIKNAKIALLEAKAQQRGKVVAFDPAMREALDAKNTLLRRVWAGIENREFVLFYQPIVGLRSGKVAGLEALIRWNDPEFGLLTPGHFIAGVRSIPTWRSRSATWCCIWRSSQMRAMARRRRRLRQCRGQPFDRAIPPRRSGRDRPRQARPRAMCRRKRLALEVTENVYMAWGADIVAETLRKLHAAGVEIALDDFGTGYASLSHLQQFPIDKLKIDKSFVQVAGKRGHRRRGHQYGPQPRHAGGGRRRREAGTAQPVRLKGCDFVQGYIFARPMEPERVAPFIAGFAADAGNRPKVAATA